MTIEVVPDDDPSIEFDRLVFDGIPCIGFRIGDDALRALVDGGIDAITDENGDLGTFVRDLFDEEYGNEKYATRAVIREVARFIERAADPRFAAPSLSLIAGAAPFIKDPRLISEMLFKMDPYVSGYRHCPIDSSFDMLRDVLPYYERAYQKAELVLTLHEIGIEQAFDLNTYEFSLRAGPRAIKPYNSSRSKDRRRTLAQHSDDPIVLRRLARDNSPVVRRLVALNPHSDQIALATAHGRGISQSQDIALMNPNTPALYVDAAVWTKDVGRKLAGIDHPNISNLALQSCLGNREVEVVLKAIDALWKRGVTGHTQVFHRPEEDKRVLGIDDPHVAAQLWKIFPPEYWEMSPHDSELARVSILVGEGFDPPPFVRDWRGFRKYDTEPFRTPKECQVIEGAQIGESFGREWSVHIVGNMVELLDNKFQMGPHTCTDGFRRRCNSGNFVLLQILNDEGTPIYNTAFIRGKSTQPWELDEIYGFENERFGPPALVKELLKYVELANQSLIAANERSNVRLGTRGGRALVSVAPGDTSLGNELNRAGF